MNINPQLEKHLNYLAKTYNNPEFIENDPICIPRQFTHKQDIEIAGLFAATIAWGNRTSIINSARKIIEAMDNAPFDFIINHEDNDLKKLENCIHRTFQYTDLLYFIAFLKHHYSSNATLENAFFTKETKTVKEALTYFHNCFFSLPFAPARTKKHVSTPAKKSACKRLNMYLRWMVRKDNCGVDFGIWDKVSPSQLIIPLDVHVLRTYSILFETPELKPNWKNAEIITSILAQLKPEDPAVYDYALFGYGVSHKL